MTPRPFARLAIVNRGEPAIRLIHAVRELNEERAEPIRIIALFTDAERDALFVRRADESVHLGAARDYLDHRALERALRAARADAVWVGWGFVAEDPAFVDLCERLDIVFVGPDAAAMRVLGNKIAAKRLAEEADVPVAPWSEGLVATPEEALRHAERIGFPVMVKAAAGGGGRGIRRVDERGAMAAAFASAQAEALAAFGDPTLLVEKLIARARHIEVQVIADGQGATWAVGLRDCSCQRRNQKVVEESSSPALSSEQERDVMAAARRLVEHAGYRNAGTVEFLYEPDTQRCSFMEVNARLQVEHPVTEAVTGLDLVKLQLHVAAGGRLEGAPPAPAGHAVEARLNAEDPALDFAPAPGRMTLLRLPSGPGLRVDTGFAEGDVIPDEFDSMIAKVVAWGRDRGEALARLRRALAETMVVIDGGATNQGFLLELLDRPEMRAGTVDTGWLDRLNLGGEIVSVRHADIALLQAAIELAEAQTAADRARFYAFARRGRPQAKLDVARTVELRHRGQSYRMSVALVAPGRHRVDVDGTRLAVRVQRRSAYERRLVVRGVSHRTLTSVQGADLLVEVEGIPHRVSRDDGGVVRNLASAVVVSIPVAEGDVVEAGDVVAVVEAMKMESSLVAPFRGRVREVLAGVNTHVAAQAPLLTIEALDGERPPARADRVRFDGGDEPGREDPLRILEWALLGYDVDRDTVAGAIADLHAAHADPAAEEALLSGEHRLLQIFADLRGLSRPRHDETDPQGLRSPQEHLYAWLRSLDAAAEGLPAPFVAQLHRALAHYGIASLDRTAALEEACYRLFVSQERSASARTAIVAILDRRLERADELAGRVGTDVRDALDRLAVALEGRDPMLTDLAREVRFRYFDEPLISSAREREYALVTRHLAALDADPERDDRDELVAALVACPRPLASMLTALMQGASAAVRRVLLEVMARRYYRARGPRSYDEIELEGRTFLVGSYEVEGARRHFAAACVAPGEIGAATATFGRHAAGLPTGELAVLDLYARHDGPAPSHERLSEELHAQLRSIELPTALHRVVVAIAEPSRGLGMAAIDLFTFRPGEAGELTEDRLARGLHPMMGHRLQLWRLANFELRRLASAEDIYAFHGVARANAQDERVFAIAELRDLTPVCDEHGRVVELPEAERLLVEVLETIRRFMSHRPPRRRLLWNRVVLHVWPVIELSPEEIRGLVARSVRLTAGLGIEVLQIRGRIREADGVVRERLLRFFTPTGHELVVDVDDPPERALEPLDEGARRIVAARRRGMLHPAEIVKLLTGGGASDEFVEHDLDDAMRLVPVERPPATNASGIVVGTIRNVTEGYPEGMLRVILLGDPTLALGSLAEPECRRIVAALDLARDLGTPLEWFALSAGAKIAMDSGTENMDWIAAVLRRIIEFTQDGGELNVVVAGINVGAQPYWNAEATMLMHTRGILVMTPESSMVLTGKQALDYSGGVSAEDNLGIGGYERIMGPNGQAQYWAPDLASACNVLLAYYEHAYVAPGERFPRRATTSDPRERDVTRDPHEAPDSDLVLVRDVFSDDRNPGRKKPFAIRPIMRAVVDRDHSPLERWAGMRDAELAVVWDAHLGGMPIALIGIEGRPLPRYGPIPADGPEQWTSGTLFPRAAKKIARAVNATAGRRPLVVLANLAGFDGSPESMRSWQLEYGAEIGRAVVNFDGPIVFCVVSRYHGGAFVVFSQLLNPQLEAVAVEGARASVIGGAPAAAVVFARDVEKAAHRDPRIATLEAQIASAEGAERTALRARHAALWPDVLGATRGAFAARFDAVHDVERAVAMGSISATVAPSQLRPFLIDAVERGMQRALATSTGNGHAWLAEPLRH